MFNIIINDDIETLGLCTIQVEADEEGKVTALGILKTHKHVEHINRIETNRFIVEGVSVYLEAFGNTDNFNLYRFTFKNYFVKNKCKLSQEELIALYEKEVNQNG
jgi:hypothetical protein